MSSSSPLTATGLSRRAVIRAGAWAAPVIGAAVALPRSAASTGGPEMMAMVDYTWEPDARLLTLIVQASFERDHWPEDAVVITNETPGVVADRMVTHLGDGLFSVALLFRSDYDVLAQTLFEFMVRSSTGTVHRRYEIELKTPGGVDLRFDPAYGPPRITREHPLLVLANGDLILASSSYPWTYTPMERRLPNGEPVPGSITQVAARLYAAVELPDGSLIMINGAGNPTGNPTVNRLDAALQIDGSFRSPVFIGDESVLAALPDGSILIGSGSMHASVNPWTVVHGLMRLHPDGSFDESFPVQMPQNSYVHALAVQPDGKILVGGRIAEAGGHPRHHLFRLNADYTLDTGFHPSPGGVVRALAVQPDGKILFGGDQGNGITRLHPDGSHDASLVVTIEPGLDGAVVRSIGVQQDGKILFGGGFSQVNGVPRRHLARLHPDGTLDDSWQPVLENNAQVRHILVHPGYGVLISGRFTSVNGVGRYRIARVYS